MIIQFLISFIATLSFAVTFSAPKQQLYLCGLTGAVGWLVYCFLIEQTASIAVANLAASFTLTLLARTFAAFKHHPVTLYLLPGIFPLVPGAGIYYTSYYFIRHEMSSFTKSAAETVIVAGSIVFGIVFGSSIPQNVFNALPKIKKLQQNKPSSH